MAGPLVAGLGSLLGGYVGGLIMGKPTFPGTDTSIEGVTKATIKKGSKSSAPIDVPQIDISKAYQYFQGAAETQDKYYTAGLQFYTQAVKSAEDAIDKGYRDAFSTLSPLSSASTQAMNEMLKFSGLNVKPDMNIMSQQLKTGGFSTDLQGKLLAANNLTDINARNNAIMDINKQYMQEYGAKLNPLTTNAASYEAQIKKLQSQYSGSIVDKGANSITAGGAGGIGSLTADQVKLLQANGLNVQSLDFMGNVNPQGNAAASNLTAPASKANLATNSANIKTWNDFQAGLLTQQQALQKLQTDNQSQINSIKSYGDLGGDIKNTYDQFENAYTGQQVTDKLRATPGYAFTEEAGTKAIERQGAAKGMLGSGNTLLALQKYGQDLADSYYGMHMDTLNKIAQSGSGAANQLAALQYQKGGDMAQLQTGLGAAGAQTFNAIGNAYAQAAYTSGNAYIDAAKYNASMQEEGLNRIDPRRNIASSTAAAIGATPGIMNAQTNAAQFNYAVYQNQQAAQAAQKAGVKM